ncbi:MAG: pyridoxal-phosphate dependent enzyme, partial [Pseudomonadota bacterium]
TAGTLAGVSRVLRRERPDVKIIVSEPDGAALFSDGAPQMRNPDGSASESHPAWTPHPIQGWTPDFIPLIAEEPIDNNAIDAVKIVKGADGIHWSKRLAAEEGIFTGISGGSTFATAIDVAAEAEKGSRILCMLPDTGERYLSTPLFGDIEAEMNEDEIVIAHSTPGQHVS